MSDTEHEFDLTSTSNQQERLPDAIRPVQSFWAELDGRDEPEQLELDLEFD